MIAKLVAYGFNKNMLSYIYSYINSRKQCFSINNVKSTFKERISGVSTSSHQRCSVKKVFLEVSRNSQENTCSRVSFFIKLQAQACNLIKKETLAQVFFCEFCKISKNAFFTEHLRTTASKFYKDQLQVLFQFLFCLFLFYISCFGL